VILIGESMILSKKQGTSRRKLKPVEQTLFNFNINPEGLYYF
jgi:hypothetical protein